MAANSVGGRTLGLSETRARDGVRVARDVLTAALGLLLMLGSSLADVVPQQQAPVAEVPADLQVRIAFAPEFAQRPGWAAGFRCAAGRASRLLEPVLGRRLKVRDQVVWRAPTKRDDLYALRSQIVSNVEHGGADLVVGLIPIGTDGAGATQFVEDGLASYSHGYLVLRVGPDLCETGALLAHEIAHIFGGVHRAGAGNLMDPNEPGQHFDELNLALLALHRDRLVRQQAPPLRGEQLRRMWRLARADLAAATTWLEVGVLAAQMQQPEPACHHYERALAISPTLRQAWVNLGHARLQLGQLDAAENAYLEAAQLDPDDGLLHNNLAVIYLSTGRPEMALKALDHALSLGYEVAAPLRRAIAAAVAHGALR